MVSYLLGSKSSNSELMLSLAVAEDILAAIVIASSTLSGHVKGDSGDEIESVNK